MKPSPTSPSVRASALVRGLTLALAAGVGGLHADDTEVFFGQVDRTADNRPNVLFVLDTSGSMNNKNEDGETRMERLEEAMHHIADSVKDINVGLMRFSGGFGGGAVVQPMAYVDEEICSSLYCEEIDTFSRVRTSASDAEENLTDNSVTLNGNVLSMGVDAYTPNDQATGFVFPELDIPQGSKIVSATIEFNARLDGDDDAKLEIRAQNVDDAVDYTNDSQAISGRKPMSAAVRWKPEAWTSNGFYETPDLSAIVEDVIERDGWCGGNALNIVVTGANGNKGSRSAKSTRFDPDNAPLLKVRYDATGIPTGKGCVEKLVSTTVYDRYGDAVEFTTRSGSYEGYVGRTYDELAIPRYFGGGYDSVTALRFEGLRLPAGAEITDARLILQPSRSEDGTRPTVRIRAHDVGDAPTIGGGRRAITSLPRTDASVSWQLPDTIEDQPVSSGDIAPVIRELLGHSDWDANSAVTLLLEPVSGDGTRRFRPRDSGGFPTLQVRYRLNASQGTPRKVRDQIKLAVSSMQPEGWTPIAGTLYEATRYLRGEKVDYGRTRGYDGDTWFQRYYDADGNAAGGRHHDKDLPQRAGWTSSSTDERSRKNRVSHPDSWTGGTLSDHCDGLDPDHPDCTKEFISGDATYISPMLESCQSNYVVMLSDGAPTWNGATGRIEQLIGKSCTGDRDDADRLCGSDLAEWMYTTDFNSKVDGTQGITTHTIGFDLGTNAEANAYLRGISSNGGGRHFEPSSTNELVAVFEDIIGSVTDVDTAFVSPGATVNQFNRLTHRDDIYFALFKPTDRVRWPGNLKRYRVADDGDEIVIQDVNGDNAVDEAAGFFADRAQSFWSDKVDGADVSSGGFAGELSLTSGPGGSARRVYTYTGPVPFTGAVDLTDEDHRLHEDNELITTELLGTDNRVETEETPAAYRKKLLKWARGVDVKNTGNDGKETILRQMGDPMHSQPVILNYGDTAAGNKTTVFVSTNQGFLHAIDPEVDPNASPTSIEASEVFSWMPKELLDNLDPYFENQVRREHTYGLDGSMSVWIDDKDGDLTVDSNEKAYLFVGMRRGGNSYYALDVSDRDSPKLAWIITGGAGGTKGFERLGQTWARPVPTKIIKDRKKIDVLVFTGGYDTNQDAGAYPVGGLPPGRTTDSLGTAIFIVEMATGKLVWSTVGDKTFDAMSYSMPGSAEVVDVNVDGYADQIYAADTGGQVWRLDITPFHKKGTFMRGGVMARLGSTLPGREQRFYYEPDVSLIEKDGKRFASISIGSGWRAHPLNTTVSDRFYVLRTSDIYSRPKKYGIQDPLTKLWRPVVDTDLSDAENLQLDVDVDGPGWYKELDATGEKVLATSLTVNNRVAFTTYLPDQKASLCSAAIGAGAVYVLDIVSGRPVSDMDGDGDIDEDDDRKLLNHPGLPPAVVAIITENNEGALIGSEQTELDFGLLTQRTYWSDLSGTPEGSGLSELIDD